MKLTQLNKRERILAILVGSLVVLFVAFFLFNSVKAWFTDKQDQIADLQQEINRKELILNSGKKAGERLREYERQSLPSDQTAAFSTYQKWLIGTAEKQFGRERVQFTPQTPRAHSDVYRRYSFTLNTVGNLRQLTQFLYHFHSVEILQRIQSLTIEQIPNSKNLKLSFVIEALGVKTALADKKLDDTADNPLTYGTMSKYESTILNRNLFGPANQRPRLASLSSTTAIIGRPFTATLRADDPDELDKLIYSLEEGAPEGARIRASGDKSAELQWTPRELGEYSFKVAVSDDGLPAASDSRTYEIRVREPDPPPTPVATPSRPSFDVARYTQITAILQNADGTREVWVLEKTTGKRHQVREGQKFDVGGVKVVVNAIMPQEVVLDIDGEERVFRKGETLRQGFKLDDL